MMMAQLRVLLAVRLRALMIGLFTSPAGKKKRSKGVTVALAILFAFLFLYLGVVFSFLFGSFFYILAVSLISFEVDFSFFFAVAAALTVLLGVFGSVFLTQASLYDAKDNELLLSMPVSPTAILLSRMLTLLLINYLFSGVVILPAFVIYLITGMASLVGAVTFLVLFLVLPALSLAICCLLGWVLALISSRMRHKNLVTLLLSLSFLVLYFVGMGAFSTMMETVDPTALDIRPIVSSVTPYLLVFNWIGAAVCGNLPAGGLFLLFAVAVCAGVMLFLSKSYIAIVTANRGTVRVKYREKAVRQSSPMWALIRKELRRFTGSAAYMMNEGLGLVFAVLLSILLLVKSGDLSTVFASEDLLPFAFLLDALPVAIGGVLCIMSSMVMISAPSVSLEGRSVWISQSMPIPPDKPLLAKVYMHILVATPFFLLSSLLSVIALRPDPFSGVMIFVLPLISNIFCAHVGVFFGILFPRLDWINEVVPLKQGAAVGFTMLTMMVLTVLLYIGMILLALIGVPGGLCMLAVSLLFFFGSLGLHAYLVRGGARRFANLS